MVNFQSTVTSDASTLGQFTAGVASTSNPTLITDGSGTFVQGDIIQISTTNLNDGFYEVEDHALNTLTVRTMFEFPLGGPFSQNTAPSLSRCDCTPHTT